MYIHQRAISLYTRAPRRATILSYLSLAKHGSGTVLLTVTRRVAPSNDVVMENAEGHLLPRAQATNIPPHAV